MPLASFVVVSVLYVVFVQGRLRPCTTHDFGDCVRRVTLSEAMPDENVPSEMLMCRMHRVRVHLASTKLALGGVTSGGGATGPRAAVWAVCVPAAFVAPTRQRIIWPAFAPVSA